MMMRDIRSMVLDAVQENSRLQNQTDELEKC